MDRSATSKSRGICRYYSTPRGCFAGDSCKFLHGADEKLTPYDKSKTCKYYARGHCTRGERCWFRHVLLKVASDDVRIQFSAETCCICLEKPSTYGLLNCSHVFCLECIRQWRSPTGKSPDVISSGTIKCCPLCRTPSRFVTPSAHFFPNGSSRKKETIDAYKFSMARVPCKYFEETSRAGKPCCPFGTDCFYQHTNPDGTPHVFCHGAKHSMNVYRRHRLRGANLPPAHFDYDDPVEFLQHIFENPITNLHATLDVIRASLPAIMGRFDPNNRFGSLDLEDEEILDEFIDSSQLPEDDLTLHDDTTVPFSGVEEEGQISLSSSSQESPPEHVTRLPPLEPSRSTFQQQPALPSVRFSTVMGSHNRQSFIIDISDDEEDEEDEDEESTQYTLDACTDNSIDSTDSLPSETTHTQQPATLQSAGNVETDVTRSRQCEHDVDPPFLTDGRGRVVWSSTRSVSGRGNATEGRASRHSRTGSSARTACPSQSLSPVSNIRGQA